ncbi:MAG: SprT-like domain-containing protein [Flavobacterium sp.]|nr:SprT-like domain-containing protein [Candidatus Neoflavobacterium equi]
MEDILKKYIPPVSVPQVVDMIKHYNVHLKIVGERQTRHGDYRKNPDGTHIITVNANLNPYRFLMTLIHEMAHLVAIQKYGRTIKPHGVEWKMTFQKLMVPFIRPEVYPNHLLPLLARHFRNPSASSDTDATLSLALKQFDPPNGKHYIFEVPYGGLFETPDGRVFKKIAQRTKRFECMDVKNGKIYLFNPNAEVELIQS